jgi:hypothetical protein
MDKYFVIVILTFVILAVGARIYSYAAEEGFATLGGVAQSFFGAEGFLDGGNSPSAYMSRFIPMRGDVGIYGEEVGYRRDSRFFANYADVQRIGVNHDFCRMIEPDGTDNPQKAFFACALAGTENLSGAEFRTETVEQGFKRSRDDYMRDTLRIGRQDYCRILRQADGTFQPMCRRAGERRFGKQDFLDPNPPKAMQTMLEFYDGAMMWLRLRDDLVDYAGNLLVSRAGEISINEEPNPPKTEGLAFNGIDQYLRIGDNQSLELGDLVSLRSMRAVSVWVYFDEFTNNAHIFDFGNGSGKDNVWLGIVGRGAPNIQDCTIRPECGADESTVPAPPSGQQCVQEVRTQHLMATSRANVDDFLCPLFEATGKRVAPLIPRAQPKSTTDEAQMADLIYEIWDARDRKMRINIPCAVPLKQWTHITVTAASTDAVRPDIKVYINGIQNAFYPSGFLPQTSFMTHNYLGKSNWANATSGYENRDELFKGKMFDFRVYNSIMSEKKIQETVKWGTNLLGIPMPKSVKELQKALKVKAANERPLIAAYDTETPNFKLTVPKRKMPTVKRREGSLRDRVQYNTYVPKNNTGITQTKATDKIRGLPAKKKDDPKNDAPKKTVKETSGY